MIELDVFLEGVEAPVGRLVRQEDQGTSFRYLQDHLPHPVSIGLPVREQPYEDPQARAFFSNLLFENRMREQIMAQHGIGAQDYVGLLAHLGADCPGAISCVPRGSGPGKAPGDLAADYDALSEVQLAELIGTLARHRRLPQNLMDPSPLAGVQSKIAVTRLADGRLALPRAGSRAPTTHILKVPTVADQPQVRQEHLAMALMGRLTDHPVAKTEILECDGLAGLLVTRFDRRIEAHGIHRLHQEDFCQALGLPEQLKYERYGSAGRCFDARAVGRVLDQLARPGAARLAFYEVMLAGLALGNTDAHGKNHAVLHGPEGPGLAPVYDVMPTILQDVRHDMAFRIGAALMTDDITAEDIVAFLQAIGVKRATAPVLARGRAVLQRLLDILEDPAEDLPKRVFDAAAQQVKWLAPALGIDRETPDFDLVPLARVESWE
ncbi:HipA domain-containing protein [Pseudooceanicola sp. CBS1P-1]|uniref:Type II toxin-antitoxin system HipA family toxin n=1 Tax=Pseudooceanicola albus TaxID=2692189 RepID=A0A6L7GAQ5_9RHOB|nr:MULTISPECIES: HipA domain-containing protein [Pseudooceanicola]MBT9386321.1 HipA domain-containing protein [Pseudooceanicola endophyticus]MXN20370.1 type II toxin-antitoxin system HipA family toxin [Pseudooceanicola albus]